MPLIAFEGIDGAGKSVQIKVLTVNLAEKRMFTKVKVLTEVRTPPPKGVDTPESWFAEQRREYLVPEIKKALEIYDLVILDRYYYSSMAYRSVKGGNYQDIKRHNEEFCPIPDLLFILDVDVELAIKRINFVRTPDSFETFDHLSKVSNVYRQMNFPYAVHVDSNGNPLTISDQILRILLERVDLHARA